MRLRLGAAAIANFGSASYGSAGAAQNIATFNASSPAGVVSGAGFAVDFGLQLGDTAALYLRGEASGLAPPGIGPDIAGYAVAEWTPRYWISLGSGLGYEDMGPAGTYNGLCPCPVRQMPHWTGVSVPVLVTFNVLQARLPDGAYRAAIRIGLEGAAGLSPANEAYDWHNRSSCSTQQASTAARACRRRRRCRRRNTPRNVPAARAARAHFDGSPCHRVAIRGTIASTGIVVNSGIALHCSSELKVAHDVHLNIPFRSGESVAFSMTCLFAGVVMKPFKAHPAGHAFLLAAGRFLHGPESQVLDEIPAHRRLTSRIVGSYRPT
jgi:hypothetical protein